MANITAQMVKELRETTGAGMMDCKAALNETGGDMEAAIDWLRTKGLARAAKKADRVAAEGLIGVATDGTRGAVVEVNSETDFVGRNNLFQETVRHIAGVALEVEGDVERLSSAQFPGAGKAVAEHLTELVATIGENMSLRRAAMLGVGEGVVAAYVHNAVAPELGKIGVLVALESAGDKVKLAELGRQIAMHVAAVNPIAVTPEEVDTDIVERERAIFADQAKASGKPDKVVEQMVRGRLDKFFKETVLLKQAFALNPDISVEQAVKDAEAAAGAPIAVAGMARFALGEGIEKTTGDFAAEVAKAAGLG